MGRTGAKVKKGGLGNALMRKQTKASSIITRDVASSAGKHVSERDGGDASVALASYLEGSSLDDFLASAVLANREFTAIKENILLIDGVDAGPQVVEKRDKSVMPEMTFAEMKVPRRPQWDNSMTAEDLNRLEKEKFMEWRRDIAMLEASSDHLEVTPFEKNLEVWRQLWHVRERSDVMVQIVDARNPLFYRSTDLDAYAKEGETLRRTLLIVNKSDFLNKRQRIAWGDYFTKNNVEFVFFSAKEAQDEIDEEAKKMRQKRSDFEYHDLDEVIKLTDGPHAMKESAKGATEDSGIYTVLSRVELLESLTNIAAEVLNEVGVRVKDKGLIKFGMVGFPNVGKSSVINALLGASTYSHKTQRVAVGATPGKTKHFQTMILSDRIMLCDCPGLVFPSFVNSKAEMYCCGVLPISQLRDHISPCQLLCHRIPKRVLERTYGLRIAGPKSAKETDPVGIYALLESYARNRGYATTGKGGPDTSRAARDILRHYVNGRLLYCHPPPDVSDPAIFDIHELAKSQYDLEKPRDLEKNEGGSVEETFVIINPTADEELYFDTIVEDKRATSKRLKKHGRKGRKGRDKNPYEDSDISDGVVGVHINSGSKKKNRRS